MGRCSGDSLFGCNVTTDKQNYVCDQCHGRKIPLSRCRFSEHYMFQGEDGHYICKKPKLQVKKFPFVYGWYHLIVFQNAKFAKKGTEVVNSKRPARFGLLTPEQVLPRGLWEDGIPLTLRKQLHRLIPIGISRDSEMYVDRITMSDDDAMDQSTPRAGAQLPNFGRRSDVQRRRRPNHFPYNVKMEDLNSNPIITTNQIPPFESPFSNTSLQSLQTPILTKGPSTTSQQRIKQEPMISSDFVTSPSASFPDLQVFMHSTDSTHTFSFSPVNKRKVTSSSSSSSQNTSFPSLSMTPQGGGGGGGGSMLPPLHPSLSAIKEEAPGNTDGFFSPASLAAFAMDSSSQAITTEFCTPLSKRRKCEVVELSTDTSGLHDFSMKNVVVTPHANN